MPLILTVTFQVGTNPSFISHLAFSVLRTDFCPQEIASVDGNSQLFTSLDSDSESDDGIYVQPISASDKIDSEAE